MVSISLCMIVKNEEQVIARCLQSVSHLVDEINIVDTGSVDSTKEIIKGYTDRIFDFTWIDDFSAARNFAFQQATKDYIFWLDADDVLLESDQEKFLKLKASMDGFMDAISMDYCVSLNSLGDTEESFKRFRLVKRERNFCWKGAVHEFLPIWGDLFHSNVTVTHLPITRDVDRNLDIYKGQLAQGKVLSARDTFYYANELWEHGETEEAVLYYDHFLDMDEAVPHDKVYACYRVGEHSLSTSNFEEYITYVLKVLKFNVPLSEACCRIGYYFYKNEQYEAAIYWYKKALLNVDANVVGIRIRSFETWVPHLQLCVCYDKIKQYQEAYEHNEEAYTYNPKDPRILFNKRYLEQRLKRIPKASS